LNAKWNKIIFLLFFSLLVPCGCAWKPYFGLHGASIQLHPDIHESAVTDKQCLECHHPNADQPDAPPTRHPNFKGCLKCHSDAV
jgi:hypothetical protein